MSRFGSLPAYGYQIILHLLDEAVDGCAELAFLSLEVAALVGGAEAVEHGTVLVLVSMRHHGLVKIEKHTDLPLLYSFVFRLLFLCELLVVAGTDDILRVVLVYIEIPGIPVERRAFLLAYDRDSCGFCRMEEHILRRGIILAVSVDLQDERVKGAYHRTFRIDARGHHSGMVEPLAAVGLGTCEGFVD